MRARARGMIGIAPIMALALSSCALPGSVIGMSAEQIHALAKQRDASVICVYGEGGLGASGSVIIAGIDRGITGSLSVSRDCGVRIEAK